MNLQPYVTQITTEVPALNQVVIATPGVTGIDIDTAQTLKGELAALVGGRVYALTLPQSPTYPNIVYQLVGSLPTTFDGYHLSTSETFILYIRAESVSELVSTVSALETTVEASAYNLEIVDQLHDYDDVQEVFRANIELTFTAAALPTQTLPAALLYPISTGAEPSQFPNLIRQREIQTFGLVIMTTDANITTLREAIQGALLGFQVTSEYEEVEYNSGAALDGGGGLELWQEVYNDAHFIEQA